MPRYLSACLVVLAMVVFSTKTSATTPPDLPTFIPLELWDRDGMSPIRIARQMGILSYRTDAQEVQISWAASVIMNTAPDWDRSVAQDLTYPVDGELQTFSVPYYPTAVAILKDDGQSLLVAGVIPVTRATIIEKWDFMWPSTLPGADYVIPTPAGSVQAVLPVRTQVTTIYLGDTAGKRFVRALSRLFGANLALVQFEDSRDVYEIDLQTGAMALIASPSTTSGVLGRVPELASLPSGAIEPGERVEARYGYVYEIRGMQGGHYLPNMDVPSVIFLDKDKNGRLDEVLVRDTDQLASEGWNDPSRFVSSWKH